MSWTRALALTADHDDAARVRLPGELSGLAMDLASSGLSLAASQPCGAVRDYAERVRAYLAARDARHDLIEDDWFADPAWDLLLDLFASEHEGRAVSIGDACIAARVPPTTALRWIDRLTASGALSRHVDPQDRRRTHLTLSPALSARIATWVAGYLPAAR